MESLYKVLIISQIKEEVKDFKTFTFVSDEAAQEITYEAGQYLTLVHRTQNQEIRRSYSITSSPVLSEPLTIGIKRIPNGLVSRQMVDLGQPGHQVLTTGTGGFFTLPATTQAYQQVFFFAAGSGITPVFALLKTVLHAHSALAAVLVYSNHAPEQTIFREALIALEGQFPNRFRLLFLFSNHPDLSRARLHKDLVKLILRQEALAPPQQLLCYICGPLNYMRMCVYGLREAGVPFAQIRKENFSTDKPAAPVRPPDTQAHAVTLYYQKQVYRLRVQYPTTILRAARQAGIGLPYSCEVGRCGNCVARCTAGQVWLTSNEVLTDKELANGLVLTCVGFPVGGDVVLSIP
jgi:ring-1,2-phenylacetyl-CoA epoxidase subunit PaaE